MKKLLLILALIAPMNVSAAYQRFWAFCEQGNQIVQTLGYSSSTTTPVQRSFPGCTVTVYKTGTTTLATLYSTRTGTALTNPFTANTFGFLYFYAANGEYDVTLSGGGLSAPWTIGDILLNGTSGSDVPVSLMDFGCAGDGVTNDTACVQSAVNSVQGSGGVLQVNSNTTFCIGTVFITGSIQLSGSGTFKRCVALLTGQGLLDIAGTGITLYGFTIDGQTTSPQVFINYNAAPVSPFDPTMTLNTSIWIHSGSTYTTAEKVTILHTGGYATFVDARTGNVSHVQFVRNTITNSRSSLAGALGDFNYGGWTGGLIWANDGTLYTINDLVIKDNRALQVTGNVFWGHSNAITKQNTGVYVDHNYFEDCGLDCIQMQNVNTGAVTHNWGKRVGYVSLTDNTPGSPRWAPAVDTLNGFSVPAVAVDTTALVTNVTYADNNFDAINGGWYDGDGFGSGSVTPGTGTSCWYSVDPNANSSACGPGSNGQNFAFGWNSGNSAGNTAADVNVNISSGQFNGFGGGAIKIYGCKNCKVIGASINHPNVAVFTPIAYGPFVVNSVTYYPTNNEISNNTAFWSPATGAVVSEDSTYAPFNSSVVNIVRNNLCIGSSGNACYELAKDNNSSSTSGPLVTHSVTPQAHGIIDSFQQTEGTTHNTWAFSEYANIGGTGTLFRTCNFTTCFFPEELTSILINYISPENGSNNAIAGTLSGVPLTVGLTVSMILQHSLQAGSNTFAYNGGAPLPIVQHSNPASNLVVPYTSGGSITLAYDGSHWQDMGAQNTGGGGGGVTAVTATAPMTSSGGTTPNISGTYQGNGSKIQLSTGATTTNDCVKFDANGNAVDAGITCASPPMTPFSSLTGSTNTTAAMVVGTGASIATSGSGTVTATNTTGVNGAVVPTSATALASNASNQIIAATYQGNGAKVQLSTGTTTTNDCVKFDANGNTVDAGSACGSGGSSAFSAITSGTNTAAAMVVGTGASLAATGSGTITATNTTGVNGAAVPASAKVIASNASSQLIAATLQGNGTKVQLSTGSYTTNDCLKADANGNAIDAGVSCGNTSQFGFINVLSLGLVGDNTTDNAPALQTWATANGANPAILYFPKGKYYFNTAGPIGFEECVRFYGPVSMFGDGIGNTIVTNKTGTNCEAIFGWYHSNTDYSYESDTPPAGTVSGLVTISSAIMGKNVVTMATAGDAAFYTAGMYVFVRGSTCCSGGQYHGEINQVVGNSAGTVQLLWPLSSDFTTDNSPQVQLNQVLASEIIQDLYIRDMTFTFNNQAMLAAQLMGLKILHNEFNYTGTGNGGIFQWNQERKVEFAYNFVNTYQSTGNAIDPARNPTDWDLHDNQLNGSVGPGEKGANVRIHHNSIYCVNPVNCVAFGGIWNGVIDSNIIYDYDTTGGAPSVVYDSNNYNSPGTVISNNKIVSNVKAIQAGTSGTVISGNHIEDSSTGLNIQAGGIVAVNNTVHLTGTGTYGCALVEGSSHADIIDGLNCYGQSGTLGFCGVWISDNGSQTNTQLILNNINGSYLSNGINISNTANDSPFMGVVQFANNVTTPYPGGGVNTIYRCATAGTLPVGALTITTGSCGSVVATGSVTR